MIRRQIFLYPVDVRSHGWRIDGTQLIDVEVGSVWIRSHTAVPRNDRLTSQRVQPPDGTDKVITKNDGIDSTTVKLEIYKEIIPLRNHILSSTNHLHYFLHWRKLKFAFNWDYQEFISMIIHSEIHH